MIDERVLRPEELLYPNRLKTSLQKCEPLYYQGRLELLTKETIGIVGSRKCTQYGIEVTKEIVKRAVNRGIVVVSGMAGGIDSVAHRTALELGGDTIAVLGGGLDVIYPKRNADLFNEISKNGLLLTEYPSGTAARRYHFPVRNRIISGLSDVVVVVEALTRSGSLITAECAIEQGKPVYAVPGNITNVYSMGTNKLIRDGANILSVIDEAFFGYRSLEMSPVKSDLKLGEDEEMILDVISGRGEVSIQEIAEATMMDVGFVNSIITIMEIKGVVFCEMGKVTLANFS